MSFWFASGQSNSTRETLKEAEDIIMRLYDLQSNARNSDRGADSAQDLVKDLNQQIMSILKVTTQKVYMLFYEVQKLADFFHQTISLAMI